jgi:hypothetical protein
MIAIARRIEAGADGRTVIAAWAAGSKVRTATELACVLGQIARRDKTHTHD